MNQLRQDGNTGLLGEEYDRNPNLNRERSKGSDVATYTQSAPDPGRSPHHP